MKQSEIILSTVALTTVMMMSSLHFTSDVQAAERPAVTAELMNYSDDEGDEITRWVTDKDGNMIPFYGDTFPSDSFTTPTQSSTDTTPTQQQKTISVVSYKQKLDICKGTTVKISDLNIKMSSYCNPDFKFSNGKTSVTFDELGTHSETVKGSYKGQDFSLAVTVYVKEEEAPTINGVHDIKCLWSGVPKSALPVEKYTFASNIKYKKEAGIDYSKYLIDPNTEKIYKPTQLLKLGITAKDCHGNKIPAKNIKVTGYNVYKFNKNQKITYTVTDSDGRTTTKSCNLYIDNGDRYYKKAKTMTVVMGGYLSESSYFDMWTGASYISVKAKKVKFKDEYGRDDGYHYVPATKPIKVKVGQKLKVVGYVVNPLTNKPKWSGLPIKIVEYNGKQYYYSDLCSNPTSSYLKAWANHDCNALHGGGLGVDYGIWKIEGRYHPWSDCSVSNYLLRRYFEDIRGGGYYSYRDEGEGTRTRTIPFFNNRALAGYQNVYVNGKESGGEYDGNHLVDTLEHYGVDLSVDGIEK